MLKRFRISAFPVTLFVILLLIGRLNFYLINAIAIIVFLVWGFSKAHNHSNKMAFIMIDNIAQSSGLILLSPELKLFVAIIGLIFSVSVNYVTMGLGIGFLMLIITVFFGKVPFHKYVDFLSIPIIFIVMSGFIILFDILPDKIGYLNIMILGRIYGITPQTQLATLIITSKAIGAVSCLYMLNLSTPMSEITNSLRKIHIPNIIIELMYLIYRYIFILFEMLNNMTSSAESRLGYRTYKTSMYTFSHIAANLIAISFLKASKMFDAMESRCYDGKISFLTEKKPIKRTDIIAVFEILVIYLLLFIYRKGW